MSDDDRFCFPDSSDGSYSEADVLRALGGAPDRDDCPPAVPPDHPCEPAPPPAGPGFSAPAAFAVPPPGRATPEPPRAAEPRRQRLTASQALANAVRDFAANPLRSLRVAALALRRAQAPPEFAEILATVPGFDRAAATAFLTQPDGGRILKRVLAGRVAAGDFVATLRRSLAPPPLLLPGDAAAAEALLARIARCFLAQQGSGFACVDDAVTVALALVAMSAVRAVPPAEAATRLARALSGDGPGEARLAAMLQEVHAEPIALPPMRLPLAVAPRLAGWGRAKGAKGSEIPEIAFMVVNSFCLFFCKTAKEVQSPVGALQLMGVDVQLDAKNPLKFHIVPAKGALALVQYPQPGMPNLVSGAKKIEITMRTAEVFNKWMVKLKRTIVLAMFAEAREPLDIPPIIPPPALVES
jgi:hypothetical protein